MLIKIIRQFQNMSHSWWYWLLYIVTGRALLGVAMLYQYVFEEQPCVMCVQVRLWIWLFVVMSLLGLLTRNRRALNSVAHVSIVLIAVGLTERSYQLLGTERGFVFGDCGFDPGLPAWFAVEKWLPWMFRVETSCGYTPELIFGITMAEALILFSGCLLLISLCVALAFFVKTRN
jgi:disulfide bond formation protein DsbB